METQTVLLNTNNPKWHSALIVFDVVPYYFIYDVAGNQVGSAHIGTIAYSLIKQS